jgi:phosphoglycerate dehydrogenase-like enzyme
MKTLRNGILGVLLGAALLPTAAGAGEDVAATLASFGIQESDVRARDVPNYRAPRKVLLLQYGFRPKDPAVFEGVAPGARVVSVTNLADAMREAVDADIIIGDNPEICDARIINVARELRWLSSLSAGMELCAAVPALKERRTLVTNLRGVDSPVIAEHAIAMMLALAHGLDRFAVDNSQGRWSTGRTAPTRVRYLGGKTILVSGLGSIGTEVARRAHGLGMKVVATRVGGTGKPDFVDYVGQPDELLALARTADVIVSCVPLTDETRGLYNKEFFDVLKPTAFFINVARGPSVVTDDLVKALTEGRLAGAGLDVVDPEPLPAGHPLWSAPRVLISPHISAQSDAPPDTRWTVAVENLRRYVSGGKMLNVVDIERGF